MNPVQLVKMANQIGTFFDAMPDREQAIQDVASHIARFWEPRMIRGLVEHLATAGEDEAMPIVKDALQHLQITH